MSAQRLRDAAKVLRELAEAATPGPWYQGRDGQYESLRDVYSQREPDDDDSHDIATYIWSDADAAYIATMHPGVALALADWLEHQSGYRRGEHVWSTDNALRVADLILGATP